MKINVYLYHSIISALGFLTSLVLSLEGFAQSDPPLSTHMKASFDTTLAVIEADVIDIYPHYTTKPYGPHWAGAVSAYKDYVYIMNAAGEFIQFLPEQRLIRKVNISYDNNRDDFLEYISPLNMRVWPHNFRFYDLLVSANGPYVNIFASTLYWHSDQSCYTMRVLRLVLQRDIDLATLQKGTSDWDVIFETNPCLGLEEPVKQFIGQEGGGKLALIGENNLLVSVGHFGFYGLYGGPAFSQDSKSSYGKIFNISLTDGSPEIVSFGHRNQQGIVVTKDGKIWATEHGAQGGDELNLIKHGENYGWPLETLGTDYGKKTWPLGFEQGRHSRYRKPVYAWLPSIGVSALLEVDDFLDEWNGDLLVGSLRANALYRLRMSGDTVVYSEPIKLNERIRDLDRLRDGTILTLTDTSRLFMLKPSTKAKESPTFDFVIDAGVRQAVRETIDRCGVCHSFAEGMASANAPNLWGVYGRGIAKGNFESYSDSMRSRDGVWTEDTLTELLTNAAAFASESPMASVPPIEDDQVRSAVIEYLKRLN